MVSIPFARWLCAVLLLALGGAARVACAADGAPRLDDYHRDAWTSEAGAPPDVYAITQTTDGWIWMKSTEGLYRFDGARFERFEPRAGEALLSDRLTNMYAAPNGGLWFGYVNGGVSVLHRGHLVHHRPRDPTLGPMYEAHTDTDGTVWLASATGLMHYAGGVWRRIGERDGLPGVAASSVRLARDGRIWVATGRGLFVRERGAARFESAGIAEGMGGVMEAPDGHQWYVTDTGLTRLAMAPVAPEAPPRVEGRMTSSAPFLFDRNGNFWTADCPQGLCLIHAADLAGGTSFMFASLAMDRHADRPRRRVRSHVIFEDNAGNIWVSNADGIERYRPNRVHKRLLDEKYDFFALSQNGPDDFWVLTRPFGDLLHLVDGEFAQYRAGTGYLFAHHGVAGLSVFGGANGIERRLDGSLAAEPLRDEDGAAAPPVEAQAATFDGRHYWIRTGRARIARLSKGRWQSTDELGLPPDPFRVMGANDGHAWLVFKDNRVVDFHAGTQRVYGRADGVDVGAMINSIDTKDEVMLFGDAGVAVLVGQRFERLRIANSAALASAYATVRSANGDRWFNTPGGLVHIREGSWRAFLAKPQAPLESEMFDAGDGYPGASTVRWTPMVTSHGGARVWMFGKKGLAWIDSTAIVHNGAAPPVEVVRLTAGARRYVGDERAQLDAGSRSVSVDYAALSYVMPERVRFKYQLVGVDRDWQDAGGRRTAYYTNLRPGDYEFKVMAANEDGVWSVAPARMRFSIAPLFVETRLFIGLCVLAGMSLLALAYWLRIRAVRRHVAERLHERLFERERIARSLHDTYLQSVQGLVLMFQGVVLRMPPADGPHAASLDAALARADEVLREGRSQVRGLRLAAPGQEQLEHVFRDIAHEVFANGATRFSVVSRGAGRTLRDEVRDEVYYIGREALLNAAQHAGASEVTMELAYGADAFSMRVADDGVGLAPASPARACQAGGHWGITGMRERAAALRGTLDVRNSADAGAGTEVVMTLPALIVYRDYRPALLVRWWRRARA